TSLIGQSVGPYVISSRLGTGGMGEVFRARDQKLGRDVAIKILPAAFTSDPERLARFAREARVLAALNHPHIGAIYGVEEAGPVRALVLELVEGPTLADRIVNRAEHSELWERVRADVAEAELVEFRTSRIQLMQSIHHVVMAAFEAFVDARRIKD